MSTMTLEQAIASAEVRNEMRGDSGRYPNGEGWGHCYGVDGYWLPKDAWILLKAHLAKPAQAVDVVAIREVIDNLRTWHDEGTDSMADSLTRALSGEKAGPVDGWPQGCMDANSCARHRACMYDRCRHARADIGSAIDAASPAPDKEG